VGAPLIVEQHFMSSIQIQSAETNLLNKHLRSIQANISVSEMDGARQQQHCQSANYYDENGMEQRETLLRSLAQNSIMLNDFCHFLEFTRVRSAQQPFQPPYNELISQEQQQIPSILNIKTNFQHKSSTPKRSRPLNESGESISSAPKQHKQSVITNTQREHTTTTNDQQRKSLPFDQLKRAVASNSPCFYIDFDQSTTVHRLPSAFEARNLIEKHFKEHKSSIRNNSM
jgi:hypothetical protein